MAKENKKSGVYYLRASTEHPARRYRIGRHDIGAYFKKFELNEAEEAELKTAGPKKWVEVGDEKKFKADSEALAKVQKEVPGFGQGLKEEL